MKKFSIKNKKEIIPRTGEYPIQKGDIVCCVQSCKSMSLTTQVGQYYKIKNFWTDNIQVTSIQVTTILEYDSEQEPYKPGIILKREDFFECFVDKQNERKFKLNKLNENV